MPENWNKKEGNPTKNVHEEKTPPQEFPAAARYYSVSSTGISLPEGDRFSRRGRPDIRGGGAEHHRVRCVLRLEQHHRGLQILNDPENAGGVRAVPQSDGAVGDGYLLRGVNRTFSNSAEASAVWR